jgi:hypothetical protein
VSECLDVQFAQHGGGPGLVDGVEEEAVHGE